MTERFHDAASCEQFTWQRNNCGHRRVARRAIGRHTKMQNVRNVKLPDPRIISGIVQTAVFGGAGAYGLYHSFFNVEGGHRAIVYNRFVGIREKVRHGCGGHVTGMFSPPRSSLNAMDRFE